VKLDESIDFEVDAIRLTLLGGGEPRTGQYTGTKALMLAVLENACRCYFSPKTRIRTEAERWIANSQTKSPFAFLVVCETLGLEPEAVRKALHRLRSGNGLSPTALRRSRPNVHRAGRIGSAGRS
jgi:hypothetical protein